MITIFFCSFLEICIQQLRQLVCWDRRWSRIEEYHSFSRFKNVRRWFLFGIRSWNSFCTARCPKILLWTLWTIVKCRIHFQIPQPVSKLCFVISFNARAIRKFFNPLICRWTNWKIFLLSIFDFITSLFEEYTNWTSFLWWVWYVTHGTLLFNQNIQCSILMSITQKSQYSYKFGYTCTSSIEICCRSFTLILYTLLMCC